MFWLTIALGAPASKVEVDLGGQGKTEAAWFDADKMEVHIGADTLPCDGESCELEIHDVTSSNAAKELAVCASGMRDERTCKLYGRVAGKLTPLAFPANVYAPTLKTSGNGIVLVIDTYRQRLYASTRKFVLQGTALVEAKQPLWSAEKPTTLKIDRTFPILFDPASKDVVANVLPNSEITVLGEHGSKEGWMLLRLSSGVTGWANVDALQAASDTYMAVMGAG